MDSWTASLLIGICMLLLVTLWWQLGAAFWYRVEHERWPRLQFRLGGQQGRFLALFYLCSAAHWLQVPYDLPLYREYGLVDEDQSQLQVVGLASSLVFAAFAGHLADHYGRRSACQLYCLLTMLACLTRHFSSLSVLLFGRVLHGMASPILHSTFEAWFVCELRGAKSDRAEVSNGLALMYFGQAAVAAMSAGLASALSSAVPLRHVGVEGSSTHYGGHCIPFDVAMLVALTSMFLMGSLWRENTGAAHSRSEGALSLSASLRLVTEDMQVLLCGISVVSFEIATFMFGLNWAFALKDAAGLAFHDDYYGHALSLDKDRKRWGVAYLGNAVFFMGGTAGFGGLAGGLPDGLRRVAPEFVLCGALGVGVAALLASTWVHPESSLLAAFCSFQLCSGAFWPAMAAIKGSRVPEEARATIYSIFRVPVSLFSFCMLFVSMDWKSAFGLAAALASLACVATAVYVTQAGTELWQAACRSQQLDDLGPQESACPCLAPSSPRTPDDLEEQGAPLVGHAGQELHAAPLLGGADDQEVSRRAAPKMAYTVDDEHRAATKLQALQRGHASRRSLSQVVVGRGARRRYTEDDNHRAATKLQALQRGRASRRSPTQVRQEVPAASQPAAAARGYMVDDEHVAATKLQALQRGRASRRRHTQERTNPWKVSPAEQGPAKGAGLAPATQPGLLYGHGSAALSVTSVGLKKTSTDQPRVRCCPQGHPLKSFVADQYGGACDGCDRDILVGEKVMDCEACDYFLCRRCLPQSVAAHQ